MVFLQVQSFANRYSKKRKDDAAVLPLNRFVRIFEKPAVLAEVLQERGTDICNSWNADNGDRSRSGQRTAVDRRYPLMEYSWLGNSGVEECSVYEIWLNTYSFTTQHMNEKYPPPLTFNSIRVIKSAFFVYVF
jgi:hypothetical protein